MVERGSDPVRVRLVERTHSDDEQTDPERQERYATEAERIASVHDPEDVI